MEQGGGEERNGGGGDGGERGGDERGNGDREGSGREDGSSELVTLIQSIRRQQQQAQPSRPPPAQPQPDSAQPDSLSQSLSMDAQQPGPSGLGPAGQSGLFPPGPSGVGPRLSPFPRGPEEPQDQQAPDGRAPVASQQTVPTPTLTQQQVGVWWSTSLPFYFVKK